jgi:signal transduction histidine kinase
VSERDEMVALIKEIRDNQRLALARQEEHLELARRQLERSQTQVEQSIELQKAAAARVKQISRVALPGIVVCMGLIVYLIVRYL